MKRTRKDGYIEQVMFAVFDGETQLTRWRSGKQQTLAALRRSTHDKKKALTLRSQVFVTPPRAQEVAP